MTVLLNFCAGVVISAAALIALLKSGLAWRLAIDTPNHRSLHARPVPRVGGWGVALALVALAPVAGPFLVLKLSVAILAAISFFDDRFGLSSRIRLLIHLLVAAWWVALVSSSQSNAVGIVVGVLLIVWMTNLYNFMDGADGMAGGMAVFGFAAFSYAAISLMPVLAVWAGLAAGAALGFLLFNFHPAKVFLGDCGSIPLGFLAGALGFHGWHSGVWPWWFPLMVFSPFIADASATLVRRIVRREQFWLPHRDHYYQRMVRMGLGHRRTALCWYLLMAISGILALVGLRAGVTVAHAILIAWLAILLLLAHIVNRHWDDFSSESTDTRAQTK